MTSRSQGQIERIAWIALFLALLTSPTGCGSISSKKESQSPLLATAQSLLPADALAGEFVIQQRITVRWSSQHSEEEESFEAALQRTKNSLLLLGFGPMQRIGFELKYQNGAIEFKNRTGRDVPFRPEDILADVQRVFYPWFLEAASCHDCERVGERNGYRVRERIGPQLLQQRIFEVIDQTDLGRVTVEYSGEAIFGEVPRHATLQNDWYGYALEIESHRIDWIEANP